jgi:hypothetical protein
MFPECNKQSGAATSRGRAPLVHRPRVNKCALTGDSSPNETGVLGKFPGKTPMILFLDKLTQRMPQGYLPDPATRQISRTKQYTPFPWDDAHFETGFELLACALCCTPMYTWSIRVYLCVRTSVKKSQRSFPQRLSSVCSRARRQSSTFILLRSFAGERGFSRHRVVRGVWRSNKRNRHFFGSASVWRSVAGGRKQMLLLSQPQPSSGFWSVQVPDTGYNTKNINKIN